MKKTLLFGMLLLAGLSTKAQIANGSAAPDFSGTNVVTDEAVSLQAYLNEGKTVVVYMSAAWCGPCWQFHNTHYLSEIYNAYGPNGSDEIRVIYVEADWRTPVDHIFGINTPVTGLPAGVPAPAAPQGDWTLNTPYPIINNDTAGDDYQIPGYPTIFVITPNGAGELGTTHEIERDTPFGLTQQINDAMGTELVGLDHWGKITAAQKRLCDATVPVTAVFESFGHAVTSYEAQLKKNGEVVETKTFTVNLDGFEPNEGAFNEIAVTGADYQAILTKVNGETALTTIAGSNITEEYTVTPSASVESANNVTITINTDDRPAEMVAAIIHYNNAGEFVIDWQSPAYTNTAANKEKTFVYNKTLAGNVCYSVVIEDAAGNGWIHNGSGDAVPHGITIKSGNTELFTNDGDFGGQVWQDATFRTDGTLSTDKFEDSKFAVYPNPSTGIFTFLTEEAIDVTVIDITGKTVHTAKAINNGGSIDLSALQTGMYIAKIKGDSGERIEKLLIK